MDPTYRIKPNITIREDVLDEKLDQYIAPELEYLIRKDKETLIYRDAELFFQTTYITENMVETIKNAIEILSGKRGNNTWVYISFFGGGKTHSLITLYHSLTNPEIATNHDNRLREALSKLDSRPEIILVPGRLDTVLGRPSRPVDTGNGYRYKTIWGYIAYKLGNYDDVRVDDENHTAPNHDILEKILKDKKVVIMIDEILEYIAKMASSANEKENAYAVQIVSFIDELMTAMKNTNNLLIITLPAKGAELEVESRYREVKNMENLLRSLRRAIGRHGAKIVEPVPTKEIHLIIKKRLFKRINHEKATHIATKLRGDAEAYHDYFDTEEMKQLAKMIERDPEKTDQPGTYPFHPKYFEVLRELIEHAGLQGTRSLIKISRVIMRKLEKDPPSHWLQASLIMPWFADPVIPEIEREILGGGREELEGYKLVIDTDLREKVEKTSKPLLSRLVGTTIFLKTYMYDSGMPLDHFPTAREIYSLVYDPFFFEANELLPPDIQDMLEEIEKNSHYLWYDRDKGVYWYWKSANINKIVESRARELLENQRMEVSSKLMNSRAMEVIIKNASTNDSRRAKYRLFETQPKTIVKADVDDVEDTPRYSLILSFYEPDNPEEIIFYKPSGREKAPKEYINTTVLSYISEANNREYLLNNMAKIIAVEQLEKEVPRIYSRQATSEREKETFIRIQKDMLKNIKETAEHDLMIGLLDYFDTIVYPKNDSIEKIDLRHIAIQYTNLVLKIEEALQVSGKAILDSLEFDSLNELFKQINNMDLTERESPIEFKEIIRYFKTNPRFPMVPRKLIEEAIKDGLKKLLIGIEKNGKLYYKKICHSTEECTQFDVDIPDTIDDEDLVYGWRTATRKQIELLEQKYEGEEKLDGIIIRKRVRIRTENKEYRIDSLRLQEDWESIYKYSLIIVEEKEIKAGVIINLEDAGEVEQTEHEPGDKITFTVTVNKINEEADIGQVTIDVITEDVDTEDLYIEKRTGFPPFKTRISLTAKEGLSRIKIIARPEKAESVTEELFVLVRKEEKEYKWEQLVKEEEKPEQKKLYLKRIVLNNLDYDRAEKFIQTLKQSNELRNSGIIGEIDVISPKKIKILIDDEISIDDLLNIKTKIIEALLGREPVVAGVDIRIKAEIYLPEEKPLEKIKRILNKAMTYVKQEKENIQFTVISK